MEERSIYTREHSRGAYRVLSYSLTNFLIYLPVCIALAVVFTSISYFMVRRRGLLSPCMCPRLPVGKTPSSLAVSKLCVLTCTAVYHGAFVLPSSMRFSGCGSVCVPPEPLQHTPQTAYTLTDDIYTRAFSSSGSTLLACASFGCPFLAPPPKKKIDLPPGGFPFQILAIFMVLLEGNAFATFVSAMAPDPLTVSDAGRSAEGQTLVCRWLA